MAIGYGVARGASELPRRRSSADNPAMQPTDTSAAERILADRARYVAPGMSTPRLVVAHAEGARVTDPDGRVVHRLRRRHRLPEHRPPARSDRRGDQGAGGSLPAPVLHDRRLRAVRRGVQAARRALAVRRRRAALDPRELRRRGGRERGEDRALGNRPAGGHRLRQRLPRADAAGDDDDEQGEAVQGRVRPVRARGLPRARRRTRTTASRPTTRSRRSSTSSRRTSTRRPSRASSSSRYRARAGSSRCRRTIRRGSRSSAASTGSCG